MMLLSTRWQMPSLSLSFLISRESAGFPVRFLIRELRFPEAAPLHPALCSAVDREFQGLFELPANNPKAPTCPSVTPPRSSLLRVRAGRSLKRNFNGGCWFLLKQQLPYVLLQQSVWSFRTHHTHPLPDPHISFPPLMDLSSHSQGLQPQPANAVFGGKHCFSFCSLPFLLAGNFRCSNVSCWGFLLTWPNSHCISDAATAAKLQRFGIQRRVRSDFVNSCVPSYSHLREGAGSGWVEKLEGFGKEGIWEPPG